MPEFCNLLLQPPPDVSGYRTGGGARAQTVQRVPQVRYCQPCRVHRLEGTLRPGPQPRGPHGICDLREPSLGTLGCIDFPNLSPQDRGCLQPLCIPGDTLHGEVAVGKVSGCFYKPYTLNTLPEFPEHLSQVCRTEARQITQGLSR